MGSKATRWLYRALLREIRAHSPTKAGTFWASMYSKETVHASIYFMPSLDQMKSHSSQMTVLLGILPGRTSSIAEKFVDRNSEAMKLAEAETQFGFEPRQLRLLTRAFFEHHRRETQPDIIEDALDDGFEALRILTSSSHHRTWAFRYSTEEAKSLEPNCPSATNPSQSHHQRMEKYLCKAGGRSVAAGIPRVGRRGNLVW